MEPTVPDDPETTRTAVPTARSAVSFGPYRLLQKLGDGGMGEVWLAEQATPVRRQVALKIIKAGMDTARVVARFEAERQALALMAHHAIATVFDGGSTPEGRPYFAMEYVKGEPITVYCDRQRLTMPQRLELFAQVCEGVQHAHQKGVIHRDLKPSNVLVTIQDDRPVPKIIDFGIAKATAQPLTDRTLFTELGVLVGTPEYMSPEQAEMGGLDIDTRTDVYALGVMLYELLTGVLPFDRRTLREAGLAAIQRIIREQEPPRPSTRVTQIGASSAEVARNRQTDPRRLAGQLRGDLDWIAMKALEKDRTRRYDTVTGLASDVRRHLRHEPVMAGPPTAAYRAGKFVRRHRVGVGMAATVLVLLVAFSVVLAVQAQRLARERAVAQARFNEVRKLSHTLIFDVHDAIAPLQGSTEARQLIVTEALGYLDRLATASDDPTLTLELARGYSRVGQVQGDPHRPNLGDRDGALASFRRASELLRPLADSPAHGREALLELAHVQRYIAGVLGVMNRRDEELVMAKAVVATADRLLAVDATSFESRHLAATAAFAVALALQPREEALPYWERAGRDFETLLAEKPDDPDRMRNVALVDKYMGALMTRLGREAECLRRYQRALDLDERRLAMAPDNRQAQFDVSVDLVSLAAALTRDGQRGRALQLYERCIAMREEMFHRDPKDMLGRTTLAVVLVGTARFHDADANYHLAIPLAERVIALVEQGLASGLKLSQRSLGEALLLRARAKAKTRPAVDPCPDARRAFEVFQREPMPSDSRREWVDWIDDSRRLLERCRL